MPKANITRVRIYKPPNLNNIFNQSNMIVKIKTDAGIMAIGERGAKNTLEQCAGALIGKNSFKIEAPGKRCTSRFSILRAEKRSMRLARSTWRFGILEQLQL